MAFFPYETDLPWRDLKAHMDARGEKPEWFWASTKRMDDQNIALLPINQRRSLSEYEVAVAYWDLNRALDAARAEGFEQARRSLKWWDLFNLGKSERTK